MSLFSTPISKPPRRERPRVPRDYQLRAISEIASKLPRPTVLVIPTGGGKTFVASRFVAEMGLRTLWLAHRTELIEQGASSLRENGLTVGIIKAGVVGDPLAPVQVASNQTLIRRPQSMAAFVPELVVIDECHRAVAQSYRTILAAYPGVPVIGLTATPFRLDGRGLGDLFEELVVAAYPDELVASGVLHAPKVYAGEPPDLRGVKMNAGDYNLTQLAQRMNAGITADVVEVWQQRAAGKRTVSFAVDIAHSMSIVAAFQRAGVPAEHIDGDTHPDERKAILERLKTGETLIVSNCMVLTEGWDLPSLECAIVCRPTASLNLHLQMIGRVMRACHGKTGAIVLDHAGNHHTHGLVTRRLTYSLDGSVKVGQSDPLGLRQCRQCFVLYPSELTGCPECGYVPTPAERVAPGVTGTGELGEFVEDYEYRRRIWNLIEAERIGNDFAEGWAAYRYKERFGAWPVVVWGEPDANGEVFRELVDVEHATQSVKKAVYESLLAVGREKGHKDGAASHRFKEYFGHWPSGFVAEVRDRGAVAEKWAKLRGGK